MTPQNFTRCATWQARSTGLKVFYREAGRGDGPPLLPLHGFPSAGRMFRELIPALSDRFRIVAPDLPIES
jgi:pimeloyl-ACP methyl ester carboxylesterase